MNPEIENIRKQISEKRQNLVFIEINKEIRNLEKLIDEIKDSCPHINNTKKYDGDTGNYDPSADRYWVNIECLDCGTHLHFYDNEEGYRKY